MKPTTLISAATLIVAMGFGGHVIAQDRTIGVSAQDRTIGGVAVPASQLEALDAKCGELIAARQATTIPQPNQTAPAAEAPAAEAPAAGASDDAAATESMAEAPVEPAAVAEGTAEGNMAADTVSDDVIDLETLTADLCIQGGFSAPAL